MVDGESRSQSVRERVGISQELTLLAAGQSEPV